MKVIGTILCKVEKDDIINDKLIIPDNITEIADNAFFDCSTLKFDCTTLKEVTIPKSIKIISPFIFRYCDSLEKINFESSIFYINSVEGISGFFDLESLKSINIYDEELNFSDNLIADLRNEEKYHETIKRELFDRIFKEVNLFINNLITDLGNEEKYQEIIKRELFNRIFKEVNLFTTNVKKNELECACRTSKLMSNYLDKIVYNIINIAKYDYIKDIHLLTTQLIGSYFGVNESSINQVLVKKG